jgi:hypothetical protein
MMVEKGASWVSIVIFWVELWDSNPQDRKRIGGL